VAGICDDATSWTRSRYLRSAPMALVTAIPRSDNLVTLHDGRSLAYAEWGDPVGRPVVLFHGTPGSRLLCPDEDATRTLGVRLFTMDRPGYGRSDPNPNSSLLTWADDYAKVHGLLGLPPCPVVGWSGGGPYALACAVRAPELVSSVGLAASPGPVDIVPGARDAFSAHELRLLELVSLDRGTAIEGLTQLYRSYADDPGSAFEGFEPGSSDAALIARPEVRDAMVSWIREGFRNGSAGHIADCLMDGEPWGFSLADVTQEVAVWWGEADTVVARPHADYLAATIPRSTLVTYPGLGHLFPVLKWAEMLAWLP
jgi:pimeloyl-ACP methyl ester carboxylesterase